MRMDETVLANGNCVRADEVGFVGYGGCGMDFADGLGQGGGVASRNRRA